MFTTDSDGTVIEHQPREKREWVPCVTCGDRTFNLDTLLCPGCKAPKKGIKCLELKGGSWVRDAGGVMRWVE